MENLIRVDANGIMLRPTRWDWCVRRRAAELALPEVKGWLGRERTESDADLLEHLAKHLRGVDGYEIARSLERAGWSVDAALVEILNEDFADTAEQELVGQWVRCVRPPMPFALGDTVLWKGEPYPVVRVFPESAQYGLHAARIANSYYMVNVEDVQPVGALIAA